MREVPLRTWTRRRHFEIFSGFDQPHFNMCVNVDVSSFFPLVRERGHSFTLSVVYLIARAANAIPEFRHRIRSGGVVEHEVVSPSTTILTGNDLFSFCTIDYEEDFLAFTTRAAELVAELRVNPSLEDDEGRDDLLFMTPIPWVSFTSFMHPLPTHPVDSTPRFAWGKCFEEGNHLKMPLSAQAHHALMDGIHMGRFYAEMQEYLDNPYRVLGSE